MKVVSLFTGIEAFGKALTNLGIEHEVVAFSEIDKYATTAFCAIHDVSPDLNLGDITEVDPNLVPDCDLITHGSPCFRTGTLITTSEGYKKVEDIQKGDKVLTHRNRFREVKGTMITETEAIYNIRIQGSPVTYVTEEHPYYVREMYRVWDNNKRSYVRKFSEPIWKKVSELSKGDFIGFNINNLSQNPHKLTEEDAWLLGRYVADGYVRDAQRSDRPSKHKLTVFCVGKDKINEFRECTEYKTSIYEGRTAFKVRIWDKRLQELCKLCGKGAANKVIPPFVLNLPDDLLIEFLEGYMSGDGCFSNNKYNATSVSKKLVFGLSQVVAKLYGVSHSINYFEREPTCIIEGRTVNQKSTWTISYKKENAKQSHGVVIDNILWQPFREKIILKTNESVYNFEVDEDNSYIANNCIVHNCQSFSVAGKGDGGDKGSGTKSSLMWHTVDIVSHKLPKYVIWENVKGVLNKNHRHNFESYLQELENLGYNNYYEVLNAKNYGIPQNRKRIFVISIRRDIDKGDFEFPKGYDNGLRLKDMLEKEVDEKYYIKNERVVNLLKDLHSRDLLDINRLVSDGMNVSKKGSVYDKDTDIASCLLARDYKGLGNQSMTVVLEPKIVASRGRNPENPSDRTTGSPTEQRLELNEEGTNTITTVQKDNLVLEPSIVRLGGLYIPLKTGYIERKYIEFVEENGYLPEMFNPYNCQEVTDFAPTLTTECGSTTSSATILLQEVETNKLIFLGGLGGKDKADDGKKLSGNFSQGDRVYSPEGIACCQTANGGGLGGPTGLYYICYRIRRLTPKECWRLMGFYDEDYEVAKKALEDTFYNGGDRSNSQMYKMAGNSICVPVVEAIYKKLFKVGEWGWSGN